MSKRPPPQQHFLAPAPTSFNNGTTPTAGNGSNGNTPTRQTHSRRPHTAHFDILNVPLNLTTSNPGFKIKSAKISRRSSCSREKWDLFVKHSLPALNEGGVTATATVLQVRRPTSSSPSSPPLHAASPPAAASNDNSPNFVSLSPPPPLAPPVIMQHASIPHSSSSSPYVDQQHPYNSTPSSTPTAHYTTSNLQPQLRHYHQQSAPVPITPRHYPQTIQTFQHVPYEHQNQSQQTVFWNTYENQRERRSAFPEASPAQLVTQNNCQNQSQNGHQFKAPRTPSPPRHQQQIQRLLQAQQEQMVSRMTDTFLDFGKKANFQVNL